jgi:hypothetical protein
MKWAFFCLVFLLAWFQAVAGFDRHIAGATHKFWLKRRLSGTPEAIFGSDFWRDLYDLQPPAPDAFTTLILKFQKLE